MKKKGGCYVTAYERRMAILDILFIRKKETVYNLAFEFGVSIRTIKYDIESLSLSYPIYTKQGYKGGIYIMKGSKRNKGYLSYEQLKALQSLLPRLKGKVKQIVESIIQEFKKPEI